MEERLRPTDEEVKRWLVSTLQHSCHVEYFLDRLKLGDEDPERPHDLVGPGNKYEWKVIEGFALQYRDPKPDFKTYILPVLNLHRQQYHHRKWNDPNPNDDTKPIAIASTGDLLLGATDANCSLLENRGYQGGAHDYEGVIEIAKKNPPHRRPWMLIVLPQMRELEQPKLEQITSLDNFPNIGLKDSVYDSIERRTREAVETLRREQGYAL